MKTRTAVNTFRDINRATEQGNVIDEAIKIVEEYYGTSFKKFGSSLEKAVEVFSLVRSAKYARATRQRETLQKAMEASDHMSTI